jgi:hypothetical protein
MVVSHIIQIVLSEQMLFPIRVPRPSVNKFLFKENDRNLQKNCSPTNPALLEVGGKSRRTLPLHKHEFTMCIGCKFKRQKRLGLRVEKS